TITADDKTKVYGAALPVLTASYSGFVNGDTSASLSTPVSLSTTATANSPVGKYDILASGATDANYSITFVKGSLEVTPAALTVTTDNKSKVYGATNPTLTATITGYVNGDTASVVSGTPALSTVATQSSAVGTYAITAAQGTLSAANYTFTFV